MNGTLAAKFEQPVPVYGQITIQVGFTVSSTENEGTRSESNCRANDGG